MILHYITIALRIIQRQKLSAFINVAGLSIGLACFSLYRRKYFPEESAELKKEGLWDGCGAILAYAVRLQDRPELSDICIDRIACTGRCNTHNEFTGHKIGPDKSRHVAAI